MLAIEIGPAMAAKLRSNLPSDRVHVAVGDFEVMDIVAGEADAVFSATAYHWIFERRRPIDPLDLTTWRHHGDRRYHSSRLVR